MSQRVLPPRKQAYRDRLRRYLGEFKSIIIIGADNIGSKQLQEVRQELRGRAEILMGKNTLIRRILRDYLEEDQRVENLIPEVKGNTGFVFTNSDLKEIRDVIVNNYKPASAKPGVKAPQSVTIEPGPTGLDPGQTGFFQSLNIPTKIVRGQIEMTNKTYLIKEGDRVGSSECALLNKLDIKPFRWSLKVETFYSDGAIIPPSVIDITKADLVSKFFTGVRVVAALGLRIGIPNLASLPHSFSNAFKKLLAISIQTDYEFEESKQYKEFLSDPEAFAAVHGIAASPEESKEAKEEDDGGTAPPVEAEESESASSEAGAGIDALFGGSGSDSDSDDSD